VLFDALREETAQTKLPTDHYLRLAQAQLRLCRYASLSHQPHRSCMDGTRGASARASACRQSNLRAARFRFGISGIVLVALDVGLHVLRWHQPHPVAKLREFTCPVMGRGAGLHADQARRQRFEELQHLAPSEPFPDDDLFGRVDP
jgi:hypothetical protein